MSKIDSDILIINICLISMGIIIFIFFFCILALFIDGIIDIMWDKPCVCEGVDNGNKQT
jgi:hypothetical protein